MNKIEHSDYLLGVKVFSKCKRHNKSIEQITDSIYGNCQSKNVLRVYQCINVLMKEGIIIPVFKNRILTFKVNENEI